MFKCGNVNVNVFSRVACSDVFSRCSMFRFVFTCTDYLTMNKCNRHVHVVINALYVNVEYQY